MARVKQIFCSFTEKLLKINNMQSFIVPVLNIFSSAIRYFLFFCNFLKVQNFCNFSIFPASPEKRKTKMWNKFRSFCIKYHDEYRNLMFLENFQGSLAVFLFVIFFVVDSNTEMYKMYGIHKITWKYLHKIHEKIYRKMFEYRKNLLPIKFIVLV